MVTDDIERLSLRDETDESLLDIGPYENYTCRFCNGC